MIQTEISADTRVLANALLSVPVGLTITFGEMSERIGRDVRTCRHLIATARLAALRDGAAVFVSERGVGYRRISAERATEVVGPSARAHIRRSAGSARKTIQTAVAGSNGVSPVAQRRASAEVNALAMIQYLARDRSVHPKRDAEPRPMSVAESARGFIEALRKRRRPSAEAKAG